MSEYNFYLLDEASRIRARRNMECRDDINAVDAAVGMQTGCDIEIWQLGRYVTRLKAADQTQSDCASNWGLL